MRRLLLSASVCTLLAACARGGGAVPELPEKVVGSCTYVNGFSRLQECRDYVGEWTDEAATADCRDQRQTVVLGQACNIERNLGYCVLTNDKAKGIFTRITFPGNDATQCAAMKRGCEFFGGGVFDPSAVCGGLTDDGPPTTLPVFQQPVLTCKAPLPGEPPGKSEGGQVCTWEMISGATEPGRNFSDYASCDRVRTQRPYYGAPPAMSAGQADPRLNDPSYVAELEWVKKEIRATACVCCHSSTAPDGPANWYLESGPNFVNSFYGRGLAMGAGWIDTVGFGTFPTEQNNGFSRPTLDRPNDSIFVTTDNARMVRFFENELQRRGLTRADFAGQTYGGGPLDEQRFFRPTACDNGEGIAADGTITWRQGPARYVYVLEADAQSPTVPPNLDLPAGTLWRIDVPYLNGTPVKSGEVTYGVVPPGTSQRLPAMGSPPALVSGKQYYLYVLADIIVPNTRCLFTAP